MSDRKLRIYLSLGLTILLVNLFSLNAFQKTKADFSPVHITSDVIGFEFSIKEDLLKEIADEATETTETTKSLESKDLTEASESTEPSETTESTESTESTETTETTESTEPTGGNL